MPTALHFYLALFSLFVISYTPFMTYGSVNGGAVSFGIHFVAWSIVVWAVGKKMGLFNQRPVWDGVPRVLQRPFQPDLPVF